MANSKSTLINHPDAKKFLHGLSDWETPDVESFLQEVWKILAKKKENSLSQKETELFLIINKEVLTIKEWGLYGALMEKYEMENIAKNEQKQLEKFVTRLEEYGIKRLKALVELAQLRNTTLPELMKQLEIKNITPDVKEKTKL